MRFNFGPEFTFPPPDWGARLVPGALCNAPHVPKPRFIDEPEEQGDIVNNNSNISNNNDNDGNHGDGGGGESREGMKGEGERRAGTHAGRGDGARGRGR